MAVFAMGRSYVAAKTYHAHEHVVGVATSSLCTPCKLRLLLVPGLLLLLVAFALGLALVVLGGENPIIVTASVIVSLAIAVPAYWYGERARRDVEALIYSMSLERIATLVGVSEAALTQAITRNAPIEEVPAVQVEWPTV